MYWLILTWTETVKMGRGILQLEEKDGGGAEAE
jgi:hypothetical protein